MTPQPIPIDWQAHNLRREQFADYLFRNANPDEVTLDPQAGWLLSVEAAERLRFDASTPDDFASGLALALANYRLPAEHISQGVVGEAFRLEFLCNEFSDQTINRELNRHLD